MKKLSLIIAAVFIFGVANVVKADGGGDTDNATHNLTVNIPLFALVDVEDGGDLITLTPSISQEAGNPLDFTTATDNSGYLNYTSVVGSNSGNSGSNYGNGTGNNGVSSRKITAKVSSELNNTGVAIKVAAGSYSGNGAGTMGTNGSPIVLSSTTAQSLITGIGSCYTGDGTSNGHNLTYSLVQTTDNQNNVNYSALTSGSYAVTITYTITDENGGGSN